MSRGHGELERHILSVLFAAAFDRKPVGVQAIVTTFCDYVDHTREPTPALYSATRRALRNLYKANKVDCYTVDGAQRWEIHCHYMHTCFHEAGHAVIARALGVPIEYATVKPEPEDDTAGHVMPHRQYKATTKAEWKSDVLWGMAGRIAVSHAVKLGLGVHIGHGTLTDNRIIRRGIMQIIGKPDKTGGGVVTTRGDFQDYRAAATKETERLVRLHWPAIELVALQLAQFTTLNSDQIDHIMRQRPKRSRPFTKAA